MTVMATATKTPVVTPRKIPAEQGIEASARTAHHRLDSACLFGHVERIENQHITLRSQFTQEHESWNYDQWAHLQFVSETDTCHGDRGQLWIHRSKVTASRSQFMVHVSLILHRKVSYEPVCRSGSRRAANVW
jgi:hypothetical protein